MDGQAYLQDVIRRFGEMRSQCDGALAQVPRERWEHRLDPGSNSLATLMQHLAGNMLSRWTEVLETDGEKPGRDRDAEFEDGDPGALAARWEAGWACLFHALEGFREEDLDRIITIRSQPLSLASAINRQLAHYSYHTGQLVFLAKHLAGDGWTTLSMPRRGRQPLPG